MKVNKKRGKYGTSETYNDEIISKECTGEIYQYLDAYEVIDGYEYVFLEKGITEYMYYKRDNSTGILPTKERKIESDIPSIILRNKNNKNEWYLILSGEDKYQDTLGNAIERTAKNFNATFEKICFNSDICPYPIFCAGKAFVNKNGEINDYILSKFREMLPYCQNGIPHIWNPSDIHTSFKKEWNRICFSQKRFTKDEKFNILMEIAEQSVAYLKNKINNKEETF